MTTPTYTPLDIVNFAAKKDAVNIQTAFDQMVGQKVHDAIQQRKIEIAKTMFGEPEAAADNGEQTEDDVVAGEQEEQESEESHEDAEQHA